MGVEWQNTGTCKNFYYLFPQISISLIYTDEVYHLHCSVNFLRWGYGLNVTKNRCSIPLWKRLLCAARLK